MLNTIAVRRYRKKKKRQDLAKEMGVRAATIISIEKGKTVPNVRLAMRLARYFNVPVNELFTWEPEDEMIGREEDLAETK